MTKSYIKTLTKNVKSTKMVGSIKSFDQYSYKTNFGPFFSSAVKLYGNFNLKFNLGFIVIVAYTLCTLLYSKSFINF